MHTKNKGKPKKKIKRKPTAPPGPRPWQARAGARVPGPNWVAVGLRFIDFFRFSFVFGMHMPLLGWK